MLKVEIEKYSELFGVLSTWRNENTDKNGYKGILPFVTGLRFSVQLLYIIKDVLHDTDLKAAWGHIVGKDGQDAVYSNECDIIIYKRVANNVARIWNGRTNSNYKSMEFRFVKAHAVVGVISCKAHVVPSNIDKKYPRQLKNFTKNVWLFGEYCSINSCKGIQTEAKKLGYKDFWCFYEWNEKKLPQPHLESWRNFDKILIKLANKYSR